MRPDVERQYCHKFVTFSFWQLRNFLCELFPMKVPAPPKRLTTNSPRPISQFQPISPTPPLHNHTQVPVAQKSSSVFSKIKKKRELWCRQAHRQRIQTVLFFLLRRSSTPIQFHENLIGTDICSSSHTATVLQGAH